jgi:hypothetical protein
MAAPMHRLPALVAAVVLLVLGASPAAAQSSSPSPEAGDVRLSLLEQTPWNSPDEPMLDLRFRAANGSSEALHDLTIGVTLFGRVLSRTAYEESLLADPVPAVVIDGETLAREGAITPGEHRDFEFTLDLSFPGIDRTQSGIYPLKIDLRSDGLPVADMRTPVIFLVRQPEQPLSLSLTFVLYQPIVFRPDGVFDSPSLEQALAPGGRIAGETRALDALMQTQPVPVDVAVSPVLLTQLARMRDGYRMSDGREVAAGEGGAAAAVDALAALRRAATSPQLELSALPFSAPQVPSLVVGGLSRDLDEQLARGRELVGTVLGVPADPTVLRPPNGTLDDASLEALTARGIDILLVDPDTVQAPLQPLGFAPPPTTELRGEGNVTAVIPDPAVAALLASPLVFEDPVRGAQALLAELAAVWQEQPGQARGLAISVPDGLDLPGGFFGPFTRGVAGAPWLRPVSATDLVEAFPSSSALTLTRTTPSTFSPSYVNELKQARRRVDVYRSMLVDASLEPDQLDTQLLLAESGDYLSNPSAGFAFIVAVGDQVGAVFNSVRADAGPVITLTSRSGSSIPVRVTNDAAEALRVSVGLVSQHLRESPSQEVELTAGGSETVTFDVDLKTTGRFPVVIQVVAPAGRVINESSVIVRSTAYNRIALIITIAAALVLVLLWARRFLPRRTT